MSAAIKVNLEPNEIIKAVRKMEKKKRDAFLEDLLAATSPEISAEHKGSENGL